MSEIKRLAAHIYRDNIKDGRRKPHTKDGKIKLYEELLVFSFRFTEEQQGERKRQTEPSDN
jgi:hypothetical protein